ncbi:MAG: hypothetical protein M1833_000445 [Piccolia ochrophora]|nr:MAG: hypothetical protein M1833_000445 [Piccolia ochrophora]
MLTKAPLVPSKAVLRVLCQLAGAGSVGGAAVLAEERRRQISTLTTIRDNAKRIRACRNYHPSLVPVEDDGSVGLAESWSVRAPRTKMSLPAAVPNGLEPHQKASGLEGKNLQAMAPSLKQTHLNKASKGVGGNGGHHAGSGHSAMVSPLPVYNAPKAEQPHSSPTSVSGALSSGSTAHREGSTPGSRKRSTGHSSFGPDRALSPASLLANPDPKVAAGLFVLYLQQRNESINEEILQIARTLSRSCKEAGVFEEALMIYNELRRRGCDDDACRQCTKPELEIQDLVEKNSLRNAAAMFLDKFQVGGSAILDQKARHVIHQLCQATIRSGELDVMGDIYLRVKDLDLMDSTIWDCMLDARQRAQDDDGVIEIYKNFSHKFTEPPNSHTRMVIALVQKSRLGEAEQILQSAFAAKGDLPIFRRCLLKLLGDTWRATQDIGQTKDLYRRILSQFRDVVPVVPLFNVMIATFVRAHNATDALQCLTEMTDQHSLNPDMETLLHLVLLVARKRDWDGVHRILSAIESDESVDHRQDKHASTFNPILVEYLNTHDIDSSMDFVRSCIEKYGLVPNMHTFTTMATRVVMAGRSDLLEEWMDISHRFDLHFSAWTMSRTLRRFYIENGPHGQALRDLLKQVKTLNPRLIDEESIRLVHQAMQRGPGKMRSFTPLSQVRANTSSATSKGARQDRIVVAMTEALRNHRPDEAVQIYESAVVAGSKTSETALGLAVTAVCRARPADAASEARRIINFAREKGAVRKDLDARLILFQSFPEMVDVSKVPLSRLRSVILSSYRHRAEKQYDTSHHLLTTTASLLVNKNLPRAALELLTCIYDSKWTAHPHSNPTDADATTATATPFPSTTMSVFFRAYAALPDASGVCWVIQRILDNHLRIDDGIMVPVYRTLQTWRERLPHSLRRAPVSERSGVSGEDQQASHFDRKRAVQQLYEGYQALRRREDEQYALFERQKVAILKAAEYSMVLRRRGRGSSTRTSGRGPVFRRYLL